MGVRLSVVYTDGTTEAIPLKPAGLVAAERQFGGRATDGHPIEATLYAAWFVKGRPSGSFDAWVDTIEDVEEKSGAPARPLAEEASPEESPT